MAETIGQTEDDRAFEKLMSFYSQLQNIPRYSVFREAMRAAFDAGKQRGLELRGCCSIVRCDACTSDANVKAHICGGVYCDGCFGDHVCDA